MKSIPPLHLDPPSRLGSGEESTLALAPVSPVVGIHSEAFGHIDFAGNWGCSADKATRLADTQTRWELPEDGIAVVLIVFLNVLVEDHCLRLRGLLNYSGHSRTLRGKSSDLRC